MNIWKVAPIVIIVLGVLDILYGVFMDDQLSLVMGPVLIVIAAIIILREKKREAGGQ
jgi:inner membrane protein involved in colicin E2 resistance